MKSKILIATVLIALLSIGQIGCKKKPADSEKAKVEVQQDTNAVHHAENSTPQDTAEARKAAPSINLEGTYEGKLDNYKMVLKITSMKDNDFEGTVQIKRRQTDRFNVTGTFTPETSTCNFKDNEKTKFAGSYSAKIKGDNKIIEGDKSYTNSKNKPSKFKLTKQH